MALWKAGRGAQVSRLGGASEYWRRKWVLEAQVSSLRRKWSGGASEKILETQANSWPSSEFRSSSTTTTPTTPTTPTTTTTPAPPTPPAAAATATTTTATTTTTNHRIQYEAG